MYLVGSTTPTVHVFCSTTSTLCSRQWVAFRHCSLCRLFIVALSIGLCVCMCVVDWQSPNLTWKSLQVEPVSVDPIRVPIKHQSLTGLPYIGQDATPPLGTFTIISFSPNLRSKSSSSLGPHCFLQFLLLHLVRIFDFLIRARKNNLSAHPSAVI